MSEENDLIERALQQDERAFATLCERHGARLWRIVSSVSRSSEREDLVQESVIRAYGALKGYRQEASFASWLSRIAINVVHDYQKSAWRRRVVSFPEDWEPIGSLENAIESRYELVELQRRVRTEVAKLATAQRIPIWLHYFEGFTFAEIARLELTAESTIRSRIHAGRKVLAKKLSDFDLDSASCSEAETLQTRTKGCEA